MAPSTATTPVSLRRVPSGKTSSPVATRNASAGHQGRALRWARLLYYSISSPIFLYSLYVQLVVLKGPGRIPLPASVRFGRDSVFLTFHGNFHCAWYSCLCLLHAFLDLDPARRLRRTKKRPRSRVVRVVEHAVHKWTGILFPLAVFVGLAYYLILHFHPMTRLRAKFVPDHDEKMALLHLVPMLFALGDALLKDEDLVKRHGMTQRRAVKGITIYGSVYFVWSCICVYFNGGVWPYPFQTKFSPMQHLTFVSSVLLVSQYVARFGFRLQARLDKRRRRRLARIAPVEKVALDKCR